jgi:hypothetical protein
MDGEEYVNSSSHGTTIIPFAPVWILCVIVYVAIATPAWSQLATGPVSATVHAPGAVVRGSWSTPRSANVSAQHLQLQDLKNRMIDPLRNSVKAKAIVFLFVSTECPISNRYAPTVSRLHEQFAHHGIQFWLIYANPADSPEAIRSHIEAYKYLAPALRDTKHDLVKLVGATVTPEAVVVNSSGKVLYRGRIDNRHLQLGLQRPMPTTHDLEDTLTAVLAGKPLRQPAAKAVGCFIHDFTP